jgi:hypothetical protein
MGKPPIGGYKAFKVSVLPRNFRPFRRYRSPMLPPEQSNLLEVLGQSSMFSLIKHYSALSPVGT